MKRMLGLVLALAVMVGMSMTAVGQDKGKTEPKKGSTTAAKKDTKKADTAKKEGTAKAGKADKKDVAKKSGKKAEKK